MQKYLRCGAVAGALLVGVNVAAATEMPRTVAQSQSHGGMKGLSTAQAAPNLTASQRREIFQDLASAKEESAPSGFRPSVGAIVPGTLALQELPSKATTDVPLIKSYKFAKLQNQDVLLVNPQDRKVIDVITK